MVVRTKNLIVIDGAENPIISNLFKQALKQPPLNAFEAVHAIDTTKSLDDVVNDLKELIGDKPECFTAICTYEPHAFFFRTRLSCNVLDISSFIAGALKLADIKPLEPDMSQQVTQATLELITGGLERFIMLK